MQETEPDIRDDHIKKTGCLGTFQCVMAGRTTHKGDPNLNDLTETSQMTTTGTVGKASLKWQRSGEGYITYSDPCPSIRTCIIRKGKYIITCF